MEGFGEAVRSMMLYVFLIVLYRFQFKVDF